MNTCHDVIGCVALECVGAYGDPDVAHHARCLEAVTADVADHQHHASVGELEHVVPIPSRGGSRPAGE